MTLTRSEKDFIVRCLVFSLTSFRKASAKDVPFVTPLWLWECLIQRSFVSPSDSPQFSDVDLSTYATRSGSPNGPRWLGSHFKVHCSVI